MTSLSALTLSLGYAHAQTIKPEPEVRVSMRVVDLGRLLSAPKRDADDLKRLRRGWLGLTIAERVVTYQGERMLGFEVVNVTPDGPAERGGLKLGDTLILLDDKPFSHDKLYRDLSSYSQREITLSYVKRRPSSHGVTGAPQTYTQSDVKRVAFDYERINLLASQLAYLLARLEGHDVSLMRFKPEQVRSLTPALLTPQEEFRCENAGTALQALMASSNTHQPRLRAGDIIVLEGDSDILIALYGGPSKCVKHSKNRFIGSQPTYATIQLIDKLTLEYRRREIQRQMNVKP